MTRIHLLTAAALTTIAGILPNLPAALEDPAAPAIRLYTLDCGRIDVADMAMFSDTDEHAGEPGEMVVPCFLVHHPDGYLLWDTGLGDQIAENPNGKDLGSVRFRVPVTLRAQLERIGVQPAGIRYVAFSHFHLDHTGNAAAFRTSTWLVNRVEMDWSQSTPTPSGVEPTAVQGQPLDRTIFLSADHDVFGDASVRILQTPGHTPGHQALMVRLPRSGTVILSGDLYHSRENYVRSLVPAINTSRAETLASMDRIERLIRNTGARLVVQHDLREYRDLPRVPEFLE